MWTSSLMEAFLRSNSAKNANFHQFMACTGLPDGHSYMHEMQVVPFKLELFEPFCAAVLISIHGLGGE